MFSELMPFALINDRVKFVHEFLERGFLVPEFLTVAELLRLYQTVLLFSFLKIISLGEIGIYTFVIFTMGLLSSEC